MDYMIARLTAWYFGALIAYAHASFYIKINLNHHVFWCQTSQHGSDHEVNPNYISPRPPHQFIIWTEITFIFIFHPKNAGPGLVHKGYQVTTNTPTSQQNIAQR